jgi:Protein of unknown function (DUF3237)
MNALSPDRPVRTEFLFEFFMELAAADRPAFDFGDTPGGHRTVGTVTGGWLDGPRVKAAVMGATDYAVLRGDDVLLPNVKCVLKTDDEALILMSYTGFIGPWSKILAVRRGEKADLGDVDWKVALTFDTSAPRYDWLNRTLAVARGGLGTGGFLYRAHRLI